MENAEKNIWSKDEKQPTRDASGPFIKGTCYLTCP